MKKLKVNSILIENGKYVIGKKYKGLKIVEVHDLELYINHCGVITWYLHDSQFPDIRYQRDGSIDIKEYHYCSTAYYPNIKFSDWGKFTIKLLTHRIAEDLGFESPQQMADYLISKYKKEFKGQIISFNIANY